jgi:hypothetical protein
MKSQTNALRPKSGWISDIALHERKEKFIFAVISPDGKNPKGIPGQVWQRDPAPG